MELIQDWKSQLLVVIIGIDGSGKTTTGKLLAERLQSQNVSSVYAKLLSNESSFVTYYKTLLAEDKTFVDSGDIQNYVFAFERHRTSNHELQRLLEENSVVIVDRYVHCDIAYSNARGRSSSVFEHLLDLVPTPQLGVLMDLDAESAIKRIQNRDVPVWEFQENMDLLARTRQEYLALAEQYGFMAIDANRTSEDIVAALANEVNDRL